MNAKFIATTLSNLLKKANLPPPYILVGHSNGGIYVQMFARLFPNKTAGIVLVDSASENQTLSDVLPPKSAASYNEANQFMQNRQELRNAPSFPQVPLIVLTATHHGDPTQKKPLNLLKNGHPALLTSKEDEHLWQNWQYQLTKLSKKSVHFFAYQSGHYIQKEQPRLVIN